MIRRTFIRQSGSALGLTALASAVFHKSAARAAEEEKPAADIRKLGIALVGLGNYAMNQLAPALQQTRHCHLAGLVTGTPEKKEKYGKQYHIEDAHIYDYRNYGRIADDKQIDAVYVVLPNSMHAEYSIRAAEAGKHVICEKPMGLSVKECQQMIDAAKANKVTLNIGYRLHYDPYHDEIRKLAAEKPHGPPKFLQIEFGFFARDPNQWRLNGKLAGGGAMMDVGIYCIQAARYSTGEEPVAVTAREYKTNPEKFATVDETIVWEMEFPSGCVASCNTSYNHAVERLYVTYRDNGFRAELAPAFMYKGLKGRIGDRIIDHGNPSQQARHMDAIATSISGGKATTTTGEEGLQDLRIIEAIYRSIRNGGKRELV